MGGEEWEDRGKGGKMWFKKLRRVVIDITNESKIMICESLNELSPQYLCELFVQNSKCPTYSLRNTGTGLQ